MRSRLPVPHPSYLKELEVTPDVTVGMTPPSTADDDWWLAVLFAHDRDGIVEAEELAPTAGPPPLPPLLVLGPVFAGALSGLILEQDGRQQIRLALPPPRDPRREWSRPLVLRLAVRWEPMRAATMQGSELAGQALAAFRRALLAAGRPG